MTEPQPAIPYAAAVQTTRDADHLRILSIARYVWGGLMLVSACISPLYVVMGVLMLRGQFPFAATGPGTVPPPPPLLGWMMIGIGGFYTLYGGTLGVLSIVTGRHMMQRRARTLGIVVAAVGCLSIPMGTVLGVFTIVVLTRASVKAMYAEVGERRT